MPATAKKTAASRGHDAKIYNRMYGTKPLPPHFGEIDNAAPFDPQRFYTLLRCVGANPTIFRVGGQRAMYGQDMHAFSKPNLALYLAAIAWINAQDEDREIEKRFLGEVVRSKPDGDFIHYLGC